MLSYKKLNCLFTGRPRDQPDWFPILQRSSAPSDHRQRRSPPIHGLVGSQLQSRFLDSANHFRWELITIFRLVTFDIWEIDCYDETIFWLIANKILNIKFLSERDIEWKYFFQNKILNENISSEEDIEWKISFRTRYWI